MSKFTIALHKNGNNSYELHINDSKEKHKISIINTVGSKTNSCRIKVLNKKLIIEKGVVERASLSTRLLLKRDIKKYVEEVGIKENHTAYCKVAVDYRERHGMDSQYLTFRLTDTYVSFHVERDDERGVPVDYLVINSRPEM